MPAFYLTRLSYYLRFNPAISNNFLFYFIGLTLTNKKIRIEQFQHYKLTRGNKNIRKLRPMQVIIPFGILFGEANFPKLNKKTK